MSEKFVAIKLKSDLMPATVFKCENLKLVWFPSNSQFNKEPGMNAAYFSIIIFTGSTEVLTKDYLVRKCVDLIRFTNFILPNYQGIKWLNNNSSTLNPEKLTLQSIELLNTYIAKNLIHNIMDIKPPLYMIDLNDFKYPFNPFVDVAINFEKLLINYSNLPANNSLRSQIELFSLISVLPVLTGKFYDNDNLEKSLMFSLAESLINESIGESKTIKACDFCNKKVPGQKGARRKISEWVESFDTSLENKRIWKKSLNQLLGIRHSFFHSVSKTTKINEHNALLEKMKMSNPDYGGYINIKDELKHNHGRFSAYLLLRNIFQIELLFKLQKEVNRD